MMCSARALDVLQCRYSCLKDWIFHCCPSQSKHWLWGCTANTI